MDDLTRIKGVGKATADKLVAAGFASFALLAGAGAEALVALDLKGKTPADFAGWIEQAGALAAEPPANPPSTDPGAPADQDPAKQPSSDIPPSGDQGGAGQVEAVPAGGKKRPAASAVTLEAPTFITVIGPARGLRRGGFKFDATPSTVMVTADQLKAIDADPNLSWAPGTVEAAAAPAGTSARPTLADLLGEDGKPVAIRVIGPAKGRRRAGHGFGASAVTLTPKTREELELILGDAELSVAAA